MIIRKLSPRILLYTDAGVGNGLRFGGNALAGINDSTVAFTPAALTLTAWVRPLALGSGYAVSRGGSYQFPKIKSDGGVEARRELNTGAQVVAVTSAPVLNLLQHYATNCEGATMRICSATMIVMGLSACSAYHITPRDNFDAALRYLIGKDLRPRENSPGNMANKKLLVLSRVMPTGNIENFYELSYPRSADVKCIYVLEINPQTMNIVSSRIESGEEMCAIQP